MVELSDNWVVNWQELTLFVTNSLHLIPSIFLKCFLLKVVCHLSMLLVGFQLLHPDIRFEIILELKFHSLILHCKLLLTESGSSQWMHLPPCQLLMLFPLNIPFGLHFTANCVLFSNYCLRRVCLVVLVLPKREVVGRHLHENSRSANRFLNCTINDEGF